MCTHSLCAPWVTRFWPSALSPEPCSSLPAQHVHTESEEVKTSPICTMCLLKHILASVIVLGPVPKPTEGNGMCSQTLVAKPFGWKPLPAPSQISLLFYCRAITCSSTLSLHARHLSALVLDNMERQPSFLGGWVMTDRVRRKKQIMKLKKKKGCFSSRSSPCPPPKHHD